MDICVCITESLCCTPESNTTFKSTIFQYKIKIKLKKKTPKEIKIIFYINGMEGVYIHLQVDFFFTQHYAFFRRFLQVNKYYEMFISFK